MKNEKQAISDKEEELVKRAILEDEEDKVIMEFVTSGNMGEMIRDDVEIDLKKFKHDLGILFTRLSMIHVKPNQQMPGPPAPNKNEILSTPDNTSEE